MKFSMPPDLDKPLPVTPASAGRGSTHFIDRLAYRSRLGWDEQRCRRYIVTTLSWVPRNYEYEDGLRLIHAELETAFGDENGDLAFGVLEELIEVEGVPPFPESLFQRWKHQHRHRKDDLQLPHVPHTRTIQGPTIPTEKLRLSRSESRNLQHPTPSDALSGLGFARLTEYVIDNAWFVSTRRRTRIWSLPTPKEHREKLSDPSFGRGGIILGIKFYPKIKAAQEPVKQENSLCSDCVSELFRRFGRKCAALSSTAASSPKELLEQQGLEKNFGMLMKKMLHSEVISKFEFDKHLQKMHWPEEVGIPNANFARKFDLVPRGEVLPIEVFKGLRQSSVDEEDVRILGQLWQSARERIESLEAKSELEVNSVANQKLFELYISHYRSPLHPVLFYDSGLDFDWNNDEPKSVSRKALRDTETNSSPERFRPRSASEPAHISSLDRRQDLDSTYLLEPKVFKATPRGGGHVASRGNHENSASSRVYVDNNIGPANRSSSTARRHSVNPARPLLPTHPQTRPMAFNDKSEDTRAFDKLFASSGMTIQESNRDNSNRHNNRKRSATDLGQKYSRQDLAHPLLQTHTTPLQIRKPSNHQVLNSNAVSSTPIYPPRRESIRNFQEPSTSPTRGREHTHRRKNSDTPSAFRSTTSTYRSDRLSDASPSLDNARSTSLSQQAQYHSESTGIIGNFVPIGAEDMASSHSLSSGSKNMHSYNKPSKIPRPNPYQFEPDTPEQYSQQRQTQFADFLDKHAAAVPAPSPSPRGHVKNSRSEGNDLFVSRENEPLMPPKPSYTLHRSESSPVLVASPFETSRYRSPSPDIPAYYREGIGRTAQIHRGRSPSPSRTNHKYEEARIYYRVPQENLRTQSPVRRGSESNDSNHYSSGSGRQSPARRENTQEKLYHHSSASNRHSPLRSEFGSAQHTSASGRHSGKVPSQTLHDVAERDEYTAFNPETPSRSRPVSPTKSESPKKRSRSPMKKMFGENGWLGRSPDEISDVKRQVKRASAEQKDKPSMMGKLIHKLGEFAEKADISPGRVNRTSSDKNAKMSILSVSLGPPEQARLLMELELMVVHTANTFLMSQFSQGRISVDSIKKIVDSWKNKGRHVVIEFMYDQATQRDLVAANQQNFRFFGERAGNEVRINSMLYNWKQVASLMAVRTFCDADTVILKLLFDVEQILELLGGAEALMLRLQQIRTNSNEMMRLARQRKEARKSAQGQPLVAATPGRAATWLSQSSRGASSRGPSVDEDPYGGMKLVPDGYKDQ